jgi:pimeloyl-ACP methyl ester carboxylesterase
MARLSHRAAEDYRSTDRSDKVRRAGRGRLRRRDSVPAGLRLLVATEAGWGLEHIGRAWDVLMKRLGYRRYVAQGGDWGAGVVEAMGRQAPAGLLGIHTNLPAALPPDVAAAISSGGPAPAGLSEQERAEFDALRTFLKNGGWGYLVMMGARPQAVGYGLTDSPAGLAGWMLVHGGFTKWTYGKDAEQSPTRDDVLDNFSLYWLTNSATSAARLYWENREQNLLSAAAQKTDEIAIPVAITVFPDDDLYRAPETWAQRAFRNLIYFPRGRSGRALCRVGAAATLFRRGSRGIQTTAQLIIYPDSGHDSKSATSQL